MSIQYRISIFFLLAMPISLIAQKDTSFQTVRQESGEYQAPVIETPSDRLFRSKVPSKWMFKMNLAQTFNFNRNDLQTASTLSGTPLGIGAEYKISPTFSVGAYYQMLLGYQPGNEFLNKGGWLYSASVAVEGRWYHDMKRRIKEGRSANNFGGRYLGLEGIWSNNNTFTDNWDDKRVALRYGLQQRFLRHGYFDISIGAGVSQGSPILKYSTYFSSDQRVSVGLAAFLPKFRNAAQNGNLCDVLHCQDEQYNMWKVNIFDVVAFRSNGIVYNLELHPNVAYEQKLGRSPFSVELAVDAVFNTGKYRYYYLLDQKEYSNRITSATWDATGELRWYYNMRKRMLNGKSGNNLSGTFFGLQLNRHNLIKSAVNYETDNAGSLDGSLITGDYWTTNLVWGIQQRILDRGFIQFKIGAGSTFGGNNYRYEEAGKPLTKIGRENELNVVGELKVGFAF
ncbi:MAG: hypothetical protein JNN28_00225 [Saprospiraceae bacterium]|nr:hypothetical protein [Saprospiraceae bacterium]